MSFYCKFPRQTFLQYENRTNLGQKLMPTSNYTFLKYENFTNFEQKLLPTSKYLCNKVSLFWLFQVLQLYFIGLLLYFFLFRPFLHFIC